jgi:hypothetical protein
MCHGGLYTNGCVANGICTLGEGGDASDWRPRHTHRSDFSENEFFVEMVERVYGPSVVEDVEANMVAHIKATPGDPPRPVKDLGFEFLSPSVLPCLTRAHEFDALPWTPQLAYHKLDEHAGSHIETYQDRYHKGGRGKVSEPSADHDL